MFVQQVNLGVGNWLADIQAAIGKQLTRGGHNGGFSRAVVVDHGKARITVELTQAVATDQQGAQRRVTQIAAECVFGNRSRQEGHLQRLRQPPVQQRIQLFIADIRRRHMQGRAGTQRRPDFPGHGIEAKTGNTGGMAACVQIKGFAMPVNQIAQGAVLDHHAFWLAGGTGGVDHVGQIGGAQTVYQWIVLMIGPILTIQGNHRHRQWRQTGQQRLLSQYGHRCAIAQQISDTLIRMRRVHRHITRARLEHGQQTDQGFQPTTSDHGHTIIRAHAQADQVMGQGIGLAIQFAVAQVLIAHLRGDGIRSLNSLRLDQTMDGLTLRDFQTCSVECLQQVLTLLLAHQRDLIQHRLFVGHQGLQQLLEVMNVTTHGGFVEQRQRVVQRTDQCFALLAQVQRQVELGHLTGLLDRRDDQPVHCRNRTFACQPVQGGLEQWRVSQAAFRPYDLHHLLEWQVLMVLGFQNTFLDLCQQGFSGWSARGIDAHGQGVDEQADQPFQFGATTACHRAADHHIVLSGQARQQRRPGRHQRHVQCHALTLGQGPQTAAQICIQVYRQATAREVLLSRTWPVGGQHQQRRCAAQCFTPVGGLLLQTLARQPLTLPDGIVGVLDRQCRQRISLTHTQGRVQSQQFVGQHAHGPTVRDDMMHSQQQHVIIVGHLQQAATNHRPVGQVERCRSFCANPFSQGFRVMAQVFHRQHDFIGHRRKQHFCTVFKGDKAAAQGFVTLDDTSQGTGQRRHIKCALQAQGHRDVVRLVATFHLRQEPQALLGEGQRQRLVARGRQNLRLFGTFDTGNGGSHSGQFAQGKEFTQRQLDTQLLANLRNHAHGQQGMPAQIEEVIVATHLLDLQHFGPDLCQSDFDLALWRFIGHAEQRRAIRLRQGTAVELAVGGQRQGFQLDERRWHHVFRQVGLQGRTHLLGREGFGVLMLGEVGHQAHAPRLVFPGQHHGIADTRQLVETADDFAQFDAETADLDLIVVTAQAFQLAIFQPATQVAGSVHRGTWLIAERVGEEFLGSQVRTVQITLRHAIAANVQLADNTLRHQTLMGIQHIDAGIADRSANRYRLGTFSHFTHFVGGGKGGGFGRAIAVYKTRARPMFQHGAEAGRIGTLAAGHQVAQALECFGDQLHVLVEQRGGEEQHADSAQGIAEARRVDQGLVVDDQQLPAVEQSAPDFHGAGIERRVGSEGNTVLFVEVGKAIVQHQTGNAAMQHAHAFRCAGGTGGVHDVRHAVGVLHQSRIMGRLIVQNQLVQVDARGGRVNRRSTLSQHEHSLAVFDHVDLTLGGCIDVQRHIGCCALADGQLADQHVNGTRQQDGHVIVGLDALTDQVMSQTVGAFVQFAIAQRETAMHGGHGLRMRGCALLEQAMHRQFARVIATGDIETHQQALTLCRWQHRQLLQAVFRLLLQRLDQIGHGFL